MVGINKQNMDARKIFISPFIENNVKVVSENGLYGEDPLYTSIFNTIASFDLFKYKRAGHKAFGKPSESEQ